MRVLEKQLHQFLILKTQVKTVKICMRYTRKQNRVTRLKSREYWSERYVLYQKCNNYDYLGTKSNRKWNAKK